MRINARKLKDAKKRIYLPKPVKSMPMQGISADTGNVQRCIYGE